MFTRSTIPTRRPQRPWAGLGPHGHLLWPGGTFAANPVESSRPSPRTDAAKRLPPMITKPRIEDVYLGAQMRKLHQQVFDRVAAGREPYEAEDRKLHQQVFDRVAAGREPYNKVVAWASHLLLLLAPLMRTRAPAHPSGRARGRASHRKRRSQGPSVGRDAQGRSVPCQGSCTVGASLLGHWFSNHDTLQGAQEPFDHPPDLLPGQEEGRFCI